MDEARIGAVYDLSTGRQQRKWADNRTFRFLCSLTPRSVLRLYSASRSNSKNSTKSSGGSILAVAKSSLSCSMSVLSFPSRFRGVPQTIRKTPFQHELASLTRPHRASNSRCTLRFSSQSRIALDIEIHLRDAIKGSQITRSDWFAHRSEVSSLSQSVADRPLDWYKLALLGNLWRSRAAINDRRVRILRKRGA